MEWLGSQNGEEEGRFSFRPCLSVHLFPRHYWWLLEIGFSGRALTVIPVFIYRNKTARSPVEESCPHSKFLLTQINSLGLLYGKLQDACTICPFTGNWTSHLSIYLFIHSFNLNSLFLILAFTSYDPRAASLWRWNGCLVCILRHYSDFLLYLIWIYKRIQFIMEGSGGSGRVTYVPSADLTFMVKWNMLKREPAASMIYDIDEESVDWRAN